MRKLWNNISGIVHLHESSRHKSVPKRRLLNIKYSANTTQMNFAKGLKLPPTRGMKSIGDDSAEDNITNHSNNDVLKQINEEVKERSEPINYKPEYHSNRAEFNTRRMLKQIKKVRPFPTAGSTISPQRILLFEKTARIGNKDYLVEISRDKLYMFIIAFLIDKAKYFTMQLPIKQAFKLLFELDNSFDAMIDLLYFDYNTLLLPDFLRTKFSPRQMGSFSISQATNNRDVSKIIEDSETPKEILRKNYLIFNSHHFAIASDEVQETKGNEENEEQEQF